MAADALDLYRSAVIANDTLRPHDKAYLLAVLDVTEAEIPAALRQYYADADRADRTPRQVLYFHLGWLAGLADLRLRPR